MKPQRAEDEKTNAMQFPNQCEFKNEIKCEWRMKVFNSSVEKRVEKNVLKMKSPIQHAPSAHCTILVQCFRKNAINERAVLRGWKIVELSSLRKEFQYQCVTRSSLISIVS
jgi:hypothetical protein